MCTILSPAYKTVPGTKQTQNKAVVSKCINEWLELCSQYCQKLSNMLFIRQEVPPPPPSSSYDKWQNYISFVGNPSEKKVSK